jgi:hypothetical protein
MRVSALQLFLRSLRSAVAAAQDDSPVSADLEAVSAGLEPFAPLDFDQFADFLRQAEQYRSSGAVSVPSAAGLEVEKVQRPLHGAASLIDKTSRADNLDVQQMTAEWERARKDLEETLTAFLKPLAITVTLKGNQKNFQSTLESARQSARARTQAARLRAALQGVTDEATLHAPERQEALRTAVEGLGLPELKAVAVELGMAPPAARSTDALLAAIIERVTGIKAATKKGTRAPRTPPQIDQAAVQQQAIKLRGLLEKSLDPGGLNNAEIEAARNELNPMSVAELQAVAREMGLQKVGATKKGILKSIEDKLREAERARESIQV